MGKGKTLKNLCEEQCLFLLHHFTQLLRNEFLNVDTLYTPNSYFKHEFNLNILNTNIYSTKIYSLNFSGHPKFYQATASCDPCTNATVCQQLCVKPIIHQCCWEITLKSDPGHAGSGLSLSDFRRRKCCPSKNNQKCRLTFLTVVELVCHLPTMFPAYT